MTGRRDFLKAASSAGAFRGKECTGDEIAGVTRAREIVRRGGLGAISYCRIQCAGLRSSALSILGRQDCVIDIDPSAEGAAFLGTRATLVVTPGGCRLFARGS